MTAIGLVGCPAWHQLCDRGIVAAYVAGLGLTALGGLCFAVALRGLLRRRPLRRRRAGLCLAMMTLIATYLLAEGGASAYLLAGDRRAEMMDFRRKQFLEWNPSMVPHPFLLYVKNKEDPGVNRYGYYGPEWTVEKPAGTLRVACLGGSTTEGGYPDHLQSVLQDKVPDRAIEVMNFGTAGWTSAQTLINYCLNVRHFKPDWLVVQHVANEFKTVGFPSVRTDYSHAFKNPGPLPCGIDYALVRYLNSYALLKWQYYRARDLPAGPILWEMVLKPPVSWSHIPDNVEQILKIYRENLDSLETLARGDNTRLLLTTQPHSRTNLQWSREFVDYMVRANDTVRALSRDRGLPLVDLDRQFEGRDDQFSDPVHLTEAGIALKAQSVAEAISRELVPLSSSGPLQP